MDKEEIEQLIDLLFRRDIEEFELEEEGMRIRIKRGRWTNTPSPPQHEPSPSIEAQPPTSHTGEHKENSFLHTVCSPIVGTFYRAPSREESPFVEVGDVIEQGQVLCIIEAMKTMNEIEAEVGGEVLEIKVENEQPVEYNEELFTIRRNAS